MSREERRHGRKDLSLPVRIEIGSETIDVTAGNLSIGGARTILSRDLPFGTKVKIRLRLPALAGESVIDAQIRCSERVEGGFQTS